MMSVRCWPYHMYWWLRQQFGISKNEEVIGNDLPLLCKYELFKGLIMVSGAVRATTTVVRHQDVPRAPPDNKSRVCCCRNFRQNVINSDYDMTKQLCMKCIYDKICSNSQPNWVPLPTCLKCDVTNLSLTAGIVALHIPLWRVRECKEVIR